MVVYSQMINKFRRFHLLKGLFITHPCLWKYLQTFLAIKFHFELLIFFIVFLILNNTILILKKNLVLKDYRPVLMVFLLSKNGILHSVLLSVFYALNVLLFLSSAQIYLHIVNKKKKPPKTSVYPPFSLMNLIAIISFWIVRIPV